MYNICIQGQYTGIVSLSCIGAAHTDNAATYTTSLHVMMYRECVMVG